MATTIELSARLQAAREKAAMTPVTFLAAYLAADPDPEVTFEDFYPAEEEFPYSCSDHHECSPTKRNCEQYVPVFFCDHCDSEVVFSKTYAGQFETVEDGEIWCEADSNFGGFHQAAQLH